MSLWILARLRPGRTASILRTPACNSYSTKRPSHSRRYVATVSFVGTSGIGWFLSTRDDVPSLQSPPAEDLVPETGPSKEEVTHIISRAAYSFAVRDTPGVNRYDGNQLASNSPCEDRYIHGTFSPYNDGKKWMAWAVFDGHAGWQTADLLQKQLLTFVRHGLSQIKLSSEGYTSDASVQDAVVKGFLALDDSIVETALQTSQSKMSLAEKVKKLLPAYAGSCALLSLYDSATSTLHVACTGDSRAVLGQQGPDGKWEAIPLSVDQTGYNEEEIARLCSEHPGEKNMIKDGRVLGLAVSRAFGDTRWKWPLDFQRKMKNKFGAPSPLTPKYDVRTPPYLTAEPVVTSTKIDPNKPSFLIMASDGIWDMLSNQQAVNLVTKWIEASTGEKRKSELEPVYGPFDLGRFENGVDWKFEEKRTTVQDENAAVHLVRNSLGGNHHEMVAGRLAFSSPFSRNQRDDMTVQVVFFNVPGVEKR
ncbi:protein serine/threonine phosphatase 2C [Penicillium cinerascens]|uniref:Protein serine/threonine phosphatase 2C n=1 Tax=Penicillium cinerascens TaxID=70096 RepID=A0A9W9N2R8_9EURO|nr:protein serine/threonine phosphatase 2C [Penicillium cinerascens]KAJ5212156.1 protein serine/threonine phosphatase 2C [Penicillium cinerascens]